MNLKYDELLSDFAFNCNLRHYIKCEFAGANPADMLAGMACCSAAMPVADANCSCWVLPDDDANSNKLFFVGRCSSTPG